jgi:hypothetical protein
MSKMNILLLLATAFASPGQDDPFRWEAKLPQDEVDPGGSFEVEVSFFIPEGHHLYKEKMGLELTSEDGFEMKGVTWSPTSITRTDPYFGKVMEVFEGQAWIKGMF